MFRIFAWEKENGIMKDEKVGKGYKKKQEKKREQEEKEKQEEKKEKVEEVEKEENGRSRGKLYKYLKCAAIGIATGMANGLFGSGGGTIAVPAMVHLLGADEHRAHATAISVILPLTVVSSVFYISRGFTDWGLTFKVTLGGLAGGYLGARLLNICPEKLLRKIFAVFMAAAGIRMIL